MPEVLTTELKSDLERVYRLTGEILNALESGEIKCEAVKSGNILERVKFDLMDIGGTLQKDIFNCDYLITKLRTVKVPD